MTSSTLFLLILLMRVAHFLDILASILTHGTFKHQKGFAALLQLLQSCTTIIWKCPKTLNITMCPNECLVKLQHSYARLEHVHPSRDMFTTLNLSSRRRTGQVLLEDTCWPRHLLCCWGWSLAPVLRDTGVPPSRKQLSSPLSIYLLWSAPTS